MNSAQLNENNTSEDLHKQNHKHGFFSHFHGHSHTHGKMDPPTLATSKGLRVLKWSFIGMMITAILQFIIVFMSGSVALLADTIHNFGDAATAIPLAIAFILTRRKPSKSFSYGYGRMEDIAGVIIVLLILFSAIVAGYESINRLFNPQPIKHLYAVAAAGIIGCIGNEIVAQVRIKVGNEIGSAALIADGYHARVDGLTSLAVLIGAIGVWLGYPIIDPLIGLLITITILKIVIDTSKVRWIGHRLHAEINVAVSSSLSVEEGHEIANAIREKLLKNLPHISGTTIHVDPSTAPGECFHFVPVLQKAVTNKRT